MIVGVSKVFMTPPRSRVFLRVQGVDMDLSVEQAQWLRQRITEALYVVEQDEKADRFIVEEPK